MDTLTAGYRESTLAIRSRTIKDLLLLWPLLDLQSLDESLPAWSVAAGALVNRDRRDVAAVAGRYVQGEKLAQDVQGAATVIAAGPIAADRLATSLQVTAKAGYRGALRYYPADKASQIALVRTAGSLGRMVMDAGRETVMASVLEDPRGVGWRRIASPRACDFCKGLAARGTVYSADTARFSAHDHCACSAEPVYGSRNNSSRRLQLADYIARQQA